LNAQQPESDVTSETTWIVVADGDSARFLIRVRPGVQLTELTELALTTAGERQLHAHATAVHDAVNHGHLVLPAHRNRQDTGEQHFLAHIAGRINLAVEEHAVGRLVICAPPRALGILRDHLSEAASRLVAQEVPKDLVRESLHDIDDRLAGLKV
jgi:protein required for attachment to host cells